jgi:hypothetical protein
MKAAGKTKPKKNAGETKSRKSTGLKTGHYKKCDHKSGPPPFVVLDAKDDTI